MPRLRYLGPDGQNPIIRLGAYLESLPVITSDDEDANDSLDDSSDVANNHDHDSLHFSDGMPGSGLPVYAESQAAEMASRPRTPSMDSSFSQTSSEYRRELERKRMRYAIDDEAVESDGPNSDSE